MFNENRGRGWMDISHYKKNGKEFLLKVRRIFKIRNCHLFEGLNCELIFQTEIKLGQ